MHKNFKIGQEIDWRLWFVKETILLSASFVAHCTWSLSEQQINENNIHMGMRRFLWVALNGIAFANAKKNLFIFICEKREGNGNGINKLRSKQKEKPYESQGTATGLRRKISKFQQNDGYNRKMLNAQANGPVREINILQKWIIFVECIVIFANHVYMKIIYNATCTPERSFVRSIVLTNKIFGCPCVVILLFSLHFVIISISFACTCFDQSQFRWTDCTFLLLRFGKTFFCCRMCEWLFDIDTVYESCLHTNFYGIFAFFAIFYIIILFCFVQTQIQSNQFVSDSNRFKWFYGNAKWKSTHWIKKKEQW